MSMKHPQLQLSRMQQAPESKLTCIIRERASPAQNSKWFEGVTLSQALHQALSSTANGLQSQQPNSCMPATNAAAQALL